MTRTPSPSGVDRAHRADSVDVTLDDVSAHRVAGPEGRLEVDASAGCEGAERRARERLGDGVESEALRADRLGREADAVDRDRAADLDQRRGRRRLDLEPDARRRRPSTATTDPTSRTIPVNIAGGYRPGPGLGLVQVRLEQHVIAEPACGEVEQRPRRGEIAEEPRPGARQRRRQVDEQLVDEALPRGTPWRASGRPRGGATARLRRRARRARPASAPERSSSSDSGGSGPRPKASRRGWRTTGTSRASRRGSSARTVPIPTATASDCGSELVDVTARCLARDPARAGHASPGRRA